MARTTSPWWLRLSLWFAATRLGTWVLSRTLPRVDRVLSSVSGGRLSIARLLSALGAPVVELTTVGTKTGKRRSVPVLGFRDGRKWVVVASNWDATDSPPGTTTCEPGRTSSCPSVARRSSTSLAK
jgi:hypothetical protein